MRNALIALIGLIGALAAGSGCAPDEPAAPTAAPPAESASPPRGERAPALPSARAPARDTPLPAPAIRPADVGISPATSPAPDEEPTTVARFAGFTAPKPAAWRTYPPESPMRAANFIVPAASGNDQAHVVVFAGIGGGVRANVERWKDQFRLPGEGVPVEPLITELDIEGLRVTMVELDGEYRGMGQPSFTPDQLFLAAIVELPEGDLQIRLVGQRATVEANRGAFMDLIRGLRREPSK